MFVKLLAKRRALVSLLPSRTKLLADDSSRPVPLLDEQEMPHCLSFSEQPCRSLSLARRKVDLVCFAKQHTQRRMRNVFHLRIHRVLLRLPLLCVEYDKSLK